LFSCILRHTKIQNEDFAELHLKFCQFFLGFFFFIEKVWLDAGGLRAILTDQNKLVVFVGGVTALAAGVYTTRYVLKS
jgi:hypothetical protein